MNLEVQVLPPGMDSVLAPGVLFSASHVLGLQPWLPCPALGMALGNSDSALHASTASTWQPTPCCLFFIVSNPISISHFEQCFRRGNGFTLIIKADWFSVIVSEVLIQITIAHDKQKFWKTTSLIDGTLGKRPAPKTLSCKPTCLGD